MHRQSIRLFFKGSNMNNVTSINEAKKEAVINESLDCAEIVMRALRGIEEANNRLRQLRQQATDLVMPGEEHIKRGVIAEVDNMIANTANAASLLQDGPMPATEFMDELTGLLMVRAPDLANAGSPTVVAEILRERARNAAQGYSGRVVREEA